MRFSNQPEDRVQRGISVVIPAFNSAAVLESAVRSVRAQDGFSSEIIVVDDGSTDSTPSILRKNAAKDLTVITQRNAGAGAARNAGIQAAHGEWIAFLDADDVWLPGKLDLQMSALAAHPDRSFCYGDGLLRDRHGEESLRRIRGVQTHLFLDLLQGPEFGVGSVIVRRSCFDRVGLFDTELRSGEDWDMWLRLSAEFEGCYVPKPLCLYHLPDQPGKYPADVMEHCTRRVIERAFSNPVARRRWPLMAKLRRRIYAWHYAVLAKTCLRQNKKASFLRLAASAVVCHPAGALYLSRRWDPARLPRLF
jgi:glycosyltransferase involved in cell wall biosynthesis